MLSWVDQPNLTNFRSKCKSLYSKNRVSTVIYGKVHKKEDDLKRLYKMSMLALRSSEIDRDMSTVKALHCSIDMYQTGYDLILKTLH